MSLTNLDAAESPSYITFLIVFACTLVLIAVLYGLFQHCLWIDRRYYGTTRMSITEERGKNEQHKVHTVQRRDWRDGVRWHVNSTTTCSNMPHSFFLDSSTSTTHLPSSGTPTTHPWPTLSHPIVPHLWTGVQVYEDLGRSPSSTITHLFISFSQQLGLLPHLLALVALILTVSFADRLYINLCSKGLSSSAWPKHSTVLTHSLNCSQNYSGVTLKSVRSRTWLNPLRTSLSEVDSPDQEAPESKWWKAMIAWKAYSREKEWIYTWARVKTYCLNK